MKTNHHFRLAISSFGLLMTTLSPGAQTAPGAKPVPPAAAALVSKPLAKEGLIGAWVGKFDLPKDDAGKGKIQMTVVLAFHSEGKCGLVFLEPAEDIDPNGAKGLTYDFPLTGKWKLDGGVVTFSPDPDEAPDEKPFALDLIQPEKNKLVLDLAFMAEPENAFGKESKVTLRPATDQDVEIWFGGKRPE